jgi:hypothetical protein
MKSMKNQFERDMANRGQPNHQNALCTEKEMDILRPELEKKSDGEIPNSPKNDEIEFFPLFFPSKLPILIQNTVLPNIVCTS